MTWATFVTSVIVYQGATLPGMSCNSAIVNSTVTNVALPGFPMVVALDPATGKSELTGEWKLPLSPFFPCAFYSCLRPSRALHPRAQCLAFR